MDLNKDPSEFTKARWKRIILGKMTERTRIPSEANRTDEGHVAGSVTSNAMRLAMSLSVQRRWIVSGSESSSCFARFRWQP